MLRIDGKCGSSKVRNMTCARSDDSLWRQHTKENAACALEPRAKKICAYDASEVRVMSTSRGAVRVRVHIRLLQILGWWKEKTAVSHNKCRV